MERPYLEPLIFVITVITVLVAVLWILEAFIVR